MWSSRPPASRAILGKMPASESQARSTGSKIQAYALVHFNQFPHRFLHIKKNLRAAVILIYKAYNADPNPESIWTEPWYAHTLGPQSVFYHAINILHRIHSMLDT